MTVVMLLEILTNLPADIPSSVDGSVGTVQKRQYTDLEVFTWQVRSVEAVFLTSTDLPNEICYIRVIITRSANK